MLTDHHQGTMLVVALDQLRDDAVSRLTVLTQPTKGDGDRDRVIYEYRQRKAQAIISICHRHFVDKVGRETYGYAEDKRTMCDPFLKGLSTAPLLVHMMREKIPALSRMDHNGRFRHSPSAGGPHMTFLKLLEIFFHEHGKPDRLMST